MRSQPHGHLSRYYINIIIPKRNARKTLTPRKLAQRVPIITGKTIKYLCTHTGKFTFICNILYTAKSYTYVLRSMV